MPTRFSIVSLFAALGACSSPDPTDLLYAPSAPVNPGYGAPSNGADAGSPPHPWRDAGADAAPTATGWADAATPPWDDAGASSPWLDAGEGSAGTCENPVCGTDGFGDCGCFATDSMGNTIELGCTDGACACFVNEEQSGDGADANGACDSNGATLQAFLASCTCL